MDPDIIPDAILHAQFLEEYGQYLEPIDIQEYRGIEQKLRIKIVRRMLRPTFDLAAQVEPQGLEAATAALELLRNRSGNNARLAADMLAKTEKRTTRILFLQASANGAAHIGDTEWEDLANETLKSVIMTPLEDELAGPNTIESIGLVTLAALVQISVYLGIRKAGVVAWIEPGTPEPGNRPHWKSYRVKPRTPPSIKRAIYWPKEWPGGQQQSHQSRVSLGTALMLTNGVAQAVARGSRGGKGWDLESMRYRDPINEHVLFYDNPEYAHMERASLEELKERVRSIHPNTVDVWLLITAKSLPVWAKGARQPEPVWVNVQEIAEAMGFARKKRGNYEPEYLAEIARAIRDLASMQLEVLRTKRGSLEAVRNRPVMLITGTEEVRDLFGGSWPLRWELQLGTWASEVPRQFAPLFQALVKMRGPHHIWAKNLGLELVFNSRENARKPQPIRMQTLLKRAGILEEAEKMAKERGTMKLVDRIEKALDTLEEQGIIANWEYNAADHGDGYEGRALADWFEARLVYQLAGNLPAIEGKRGRPKKPRAQLAPEKS